MKHMTYMENITKHNKHGNHETNTTYHMLTHVQCVFVYTKQPFNHTKFLIIRMVVNTHLKMFVDSTSSKIQYATPNNMLDNIVQIPFVLAYSNKSYPLSNFILTTYPKPWNANDIHAATKNMKHMKIMANAQNWKHLKATNVNAHPFCFSYTIQPYMVDDC